MHDGDSPEGPPGLQGEDLATEYWEDARDWIAIYEDLIRFKHGLLDRVRRTLPALAPVAQRAASADFEIIENQLHGYNVRLDLWYQRLWQLHGLTLDPESSAVHYQGRESHLTNREFQLLQFLIDHPHRFLTAPQLVSRAWADPALSPEELRNYVRRLRRLLRDLEIPCTLVNHHGRGYSLVLRPDP